MVAEDEKIDGDPARLVEVPSDLTTDTVFDGFRLEVGLGQFATGMYIEGSPTVSANRFVAGTPSGGVGSSAIVVDEGQPTVVGNHIELVYDGAFQVEGIETYLADPLIINNVIILEGIDSGAHALDILGGAPQIVGNSIIAVDATNVFLIRMIGTTPLIDNNVLQSDAGTAICVGSLTGTAIPTSLHNNLLQCTYPVWGNGDSPFSPFTTISEVHASVDNASGNVKLVGPAVTAADDLMLDGDTPCSVARGGLDVSASYPEDVAGLARTDPLSIGAHEWDGACQ